MRQRVIAYVDGYNLYYGICAGQFRRYLWLSVRSMCRALLKPDQDLVRTKYFTARITSPPGSVKRQGNYVEALLTLPDLSVYEGRYDGEDHQCRRCGAAIRIHNEKMTDVNIAVEITKDAHADQFDTALLVTGDADQVPTIRMVKELFPTKRIVCAFPPRRVSDWLRREAHGHVHINEKILAGSQLPAVVAKSDGYELRQPVEWQ